MQIIIPMSGFGERFRRAGYDVPKPLIEIDGMPIIAHVIDMFPGEHDFIFICNQVFQYCFIRSLSVALGSVFGDKWVSTYAS